MAHLSNPMLPYPYRINRMIRETVDTFSMELMPSNGQSIGQFKPGQFNMLYIFGVGEVPISISGDPMKPDVLVHTTRAVGSVTNVMKTLKQGMTIGVRGPYGSDWPIDNAYGDDIVLVAGGIGLAPLRPVLYRILSDRKKFGNVVLLYGARTPEEILFKKELEKWRKRFDLDIYVTVDRATGNWHGNVGVVTRFIPRAPFDPYNATAMVCGPEVMMDFTVTGLQNRGMSAKKIYISMERNMKCAIGFCGHCQYGPKFICKDGPVFRCDEIEELIEIREL